MALTAKQQGLKLATMARNPIKVRGMAKPGALRETVPDGRKTPRERP